MTAVASCKALIIEKPVYICVPDENLSSKPKVSRRRYPARRGFLWEEWNKEKGEGL